METRTFHLRPSALIGPSELRPRSFMTRNLFTCFDLGKVDIRPLTLGRRNVFKWQLLNLCRQTSATRW